MDDKLNLKKNFTEASGPCFKSPKGLKVVPLYVRLNDLKRLFRLLFHPPSPELGNNFRHVSIFQWIIIQLLFLWRGFRMVILGAVTDSDNKQVFKLEGVIAEFPRAR